MTSEPAFREPGRTRVVVLGASHWHTPLYRDAVLRRHEVLAVQDAQPAAVADGAAWNAPIVASVDEALAFPDIDLAYVLSPHDEVAAVCRTLVDRGIPFAVEKPLGVDLAELRSVVAAAHAADVPATVALVQRGGPVDVWLRKAGRISYERASFIAGPPSRYRHGGSPWMLDPARAGGGALVNLGPHFVDLALQHLGPAAVSLRSRSHSLHGETVEDHATLVLTTDAGAEAVIEVGYAFPDAPAKRYCSFTAAGTDGFVSIDTDGTARFTGTDGVTDQTVIDVDSDPLYTRFVDAVADSLADGFRRMPTLDDLEDTMARIWHGDGTEGVQR